MLIKTQFSSLSTLGANSHSGIIIHYTETSLILNEIMKAAGFTGASINFTELLFKQIGGGLSEEWHLFTDKQLSETAKRTDRTIRNWRKTFISESQRLNFSFLEAVEGEYESNKQRYQSFRYRFPESVLNILGEAVAYFLSLEPSQKQRHDAAVMVAARFIENFPTTKPIRKRKQSPRRRDDTASSVRRTRRYLEKIVSSNRFEADKHNDFEIIKPDIEAIAEMLKLF